ncbi:hypothetical protein [Pseudomonas kurunegalensis]|uniref:hypothetical protein n=1 Tax=Pseudomonas kurunegalensis TaxID=485880 RepID=UPI00236478E6|nr:hypothetical protein [Pseudomonas kurunegalensis]MDD2133329.1 hypothetical protein [Pseudomonas kurunegalensis]
MRPSRSLLLICALFLLPVILIASAALYYYVTTFSGGLSNNSTHWSEFGGYIGGVLGPAVSFFALVGVVVTVHYQRELLVSQRNEIKRLSDAQRYEQFVSEFNSLCDRIDNYAESNLRGTRGLRKLLETHSSYSNALEGSRFAKLRNARKFVRGSTPRKYEVFALSARRLILRVDGATGVPDSQKRYFVALFLSSLKPEEHVFFLNWSFLFFIKGKRRMLKYKPAKEVYGDSLLADDARSFFTLKDYLIPKKWRFSERS